ncbi:C-type lectin domain family 10 member A MMGL [Triplophysa tibetana]|uniref:C-type lectin domain family 10 member A MMGL n=1 Tax=Triplophysa tibetana TaxID=1572043 RepID=A0A5A9PGT8_9TELE|nr:C-type lectin domain family 10 member A MMGL [Triplophysa tibetana]
MLPLLLLSGFITCTLCVPRQYIFVNENKTWTEAQSYCRDKYTDLVTVENEQETMQLLNTVNDYNSTDLAWIGLYDDLNSWKWTLEDSEFFSQEQKQFRNWYKGETVNYGGQSLCVYINAYYGVWYTANCNNTFSFICYDGRQNASSRYVLVYQEKNWIEAQRYCREYHTDLVSFRNEDDIQNIRNSLNNYYYTSVWIGLYRTRSWSDQSNSTFSNWKTGEPNYAGNCTAVSFNDSLWTDENCYDQLPFICYNVSSLTSSRQYHFISENKSWSEAQTYCRQNYTDLATIDNMTEMNSVMNTVNGSYNGPAWIGQYDDVNSWRWSLDDDDFYQGGEREFRNWFHEPNNYGGNDLCVYMSNDGSWFDLSCDYSLPFVCYDGRGNTSQRYIWVNQSRSWSEAQRYCRQFYTDLAIVRNETEHQQILNVTDSNGHIGWIGLYRNRLWSDQSNSSFTYWLPGTQYVSPQPDNGANVSGLRGAQHCTAVSLKSLGQWTDENCFERLPFFCYGDKYVVGLRLQVTSKENLSKSRIEELVIINSRKNLKDVDFPVTTP